MNLLRFIEQASIFIEIFKFTSSLSLFYNKQKLIIKLVDDIKEYSILFFGGQISFEIEPIPSLIRFCNEISESERFRCKSSLNTVFYDFSISIKILFTTCKRRSVLSLAL
jgi:hypothetical protein